MSYQVRILRTAQKDLANVPQEAFDSLKEALLALQDNPRPSGGSKLVAREGWRIRVRDYRVIYEINDHERIITILHIGHRRDICR